MLFELEHESPLPHVPETDERVLSSCSQKIAIRAESETIDSSFVTFAGLTQELLRVKAPEPHAALIIAYSQGLPIGAEREAPDPSRVCSILAFELPGRGRWMI
jgi:hypothetical protein